MILIKKIRIYAPEDLGVKDILIANDKILEIGEGLENFVLPGTKIIDGKGKIAVPGFVDQHVHITGGGGESGYASKIHEISLTDCIKNGVTSVVGLLGTDSSSRSVENLVSKTKGLKQEGMSAWCLTGGYEYPSANLTGQVKKDIMFIDEVIGVKLAISDHRSSYPTVEELIKLVTQARVAGLFTGKAGVVHMHTGRGKAGLTDVLEVLDRTDIPIWHFRPTHIDRQPGAEEFAKRGGYIDVTTGTDTEAKQDVILRWMDIAEDGKLTLSSDSNGSMPIWSKENTLIGIGVSDISSLYHTVKQLILKHKVPVTQAIRLITENVAKGLNLYPAKGCICPGSDADLVILREDYEIDQVIALGKTDLKDYYTQK